MFFDAKEYHTSNKQVANILSSTNAPTETVQTTSGAALLNAGDNWGDDDEIDIEPDTINNGDENGQLD
jgi:hypothetical protein